MNSPKFASFSIDAVSGFGKSFDSSMNSPQQQSPSPYQSRTDYDSEFGSYDAKYGAINLNVSDEDLADHDELLDTLVKEAKASTKSHLISIKKRLIEEKVVALQAAEQEYLNKYSVLHDEITGLKNDILSLETLREATAERRDIVMDSFSLVLQSNQTRYKSAHSVIKLFHAWKHCTQAASYLRRIEKTVGYFTRKTALCRAMSTMRANFHIRRSAKLQQEARFKFDKVTNEMVTRYETDLAQLRSDLRDAYGTAQAETHKRQQLEEDLRRMFLKNMTNMNMEALTLFHSSYNSSSNNAEGGHSAGGNAAASSGEDRHAAAHAPQRQPGSPPRAQQSTRTPTSPQPMPRALPFPSAACNDLQHLLHSQQRGQTPAGGSSGASVGSSVSSSSAAHHQLQQRELQQIQKLAASRQLFQQQSQPGGESQQQQIAEIYQSTLAATGKLARNASSSSGQSSASAVKLLHTASPQQPQQQVRRQQVSPGSSNGLGSSGARSAPVARR